MLLYKLILPLKKADVLKQENRFCGCFMQWREETGECVKRFPNSSGGSNCSGFRTRSFKLLRGPGIDSKESIPPAYVA